RLLKFFPRGYASSVDTNIGDEYQMDLDATGHWKLGPLHLWVARFKNEWRISNTSSHDPDDRTIEVESPFKGHTSIPKDIEIARFGGKETGSSIRFTPALADRPVVIRPEMPFYLPSNDEVTIFVSTPLWLNVTVQPNSRKLFSIPILHLSDSWFGADPTEGELCYAARSKAKLRFEDLK